MSNLKRKGPGGRDDSSSSESDRGANIAPTKKPRLFMLPRPGGAPSTSSSTFPRPKPLVLKQATPASGADQQPKGAQLPRVPSTPRDASSMEAKQGYNVTLNNATPSSSSLLKTSVVSKRRQETENTRESSDDETSRPPTTGARQRVQFERGLNEIRTNLEAFKADVNERLTRIEESQACSRERQDVMIAKLDEVLSNFEKLNDLDSTPSTSSALVASREAKPTILNTNPEADLGLQDVCRSAARKGAIGAELGKFQSPIKDFIRRGVFLSLRIQDFKRAPMFYSKNGAPDIFPEAFREPSGYCQPFLHWNQPFATSYQAVPTLILSIKSLFPKDDTSLGKAARALTDEQIISLIYHGPFKSLRQSFNGSKAASPDDPDIRDAGKQGVSRLEEKFFHRRLYRPQIIVLLEPGWDGIWLKRVMSPEIRDDAGGFIILRPIWRATWLNKLLMAIDNLRRAAQLAKPGNHFRAKRTVQYVEGPPPTLLSDEGKVVRIPLCAFSKDWRKKNQGWMETMSHMIDTSLSKKPDVSAFIDDHPAPAEPEYDEEEGDGVGDVDGVVDEEGDKEEDEEEEEENREGDKEGLAEEDREEDKGEDKGERATKQVLLNTEPGQVDQQDTVAKDEAANKDSHVLNVAQGARIDLRSLSGPVAGILQPQQDIPIDPTLLTPSSEARLLDLDADPPLSNLPDAQVSSHTIDGQDQTSPVTDPLPAPMFPAMPPPPLPEQNTTPPAADQDIGPKPTTAKKKGQKAGNLPLTTALDGPSTSTATTNPEANGPKEQPVKRGRGRPRGALGKKTIERLAAAGKQTQSS